MTDLLLAHAYFLALDAEEQRVMRPHPPLGLLYLSSHLKQRGVAVSVFDATFRPFDDTVKATMAFYAGQSEERKAQLRAGLAADREAAVLAAWKARPTGR